MANGTYSNENFLRSLSGKCNMLKIKNAEALFCGFEVHQKSKGGALNRRCDYKLSIWKGLFSRRLINIVLNVWKELTEQSKEGFNSLPISSEHANSPEVLMAISELIP